MDAELGGSIVYGMTRDGALRHIDDVERGEACGCFCPDSNCGQPLVAKKGKIKRHHFAHKRGTCEWAVESVISLVAEQVIAKRGEMVFPELRYYDHVRKKEEIIARAQRIRVSSVELVEVSGRGNLDLVVVTGKGDRRFLLVVSLIHKIKQAQLERIAASGMDAIHVDLGSIYNWRKRNDKHYDRDALPLEFQSPEFLTSVLVDGDGRWMKWITNTKQSEKQKASKLEYEAWEEKERAKLQQKAAKREEERHEAEIRKRERELERARQEEERRREWEKTNMTVERELVSISLNQQEKKVWDTDNNRWLRCEECGKEATDGEFTSFGGKGQFNLGVCRECSMKRDKGR